MRANFCIVFLILLSIAYCQAQVGSSSIQPQGASANAADYVLQGRVTDLISGQGIGLATIQAIDAHLVAHVTLSNPDGTYRLDHLPREQTLAVRCSQLGYSPNPRGDTAMFSGGVANWNPRLVQQNGDNNYRHSAAALLAALPANERITTAKYIAANVSQASRNGIAAEINGVNGRGDLAASEVFFRAGPASDEVIRLAVQDAVVQSDKTHPGAVSPISVDVLNGHVRLGGTVSSEEEKVHVYRVAETVPSLVDVENNVTVKTTSPQ